jgi:hypothetical protein
MSQVAPQRQLRIGPTVGPQDGIAHRGRSADQDHTVHLPVDAHRHDPYVGTLRQHLGNAGAGGRGPLGRWRLRPTGMG